MKTTAAELPAAFPDPGHAPDDHTFETVLGAAFAPVGKILAGLRDAQPGVSLAAHYSKKSGWYRTVSLKQRRLLYLIPKQDNFRLSLIVGPRAISSLAQSPHARTIARLLKTAKCYPEGTAFSFDRTNCDVELVIALVTAKLGQ